MIALVRHAHAGEKNAGERSGTHDLRRPLTERGWQQAEGLAENLSPLRPPRLIASPYLRCSQSLAPLSARCGRIVETSDLLSPSADVHALDGFVGDAGLDGAVLCTHGETLKGLLSLWRSRGTVDFQYNGAHLPADGTEKGAVWLVDTDAGRISANYLRPLHVGPVLGKVGR